MALKVVHYILFKGKGVGWGAWRESCRLSCHTALRSSTGTERSAAISRQKGESQKTQREMHVTLEESSQ